jgi:hypothetical protein
MARNKEHTMATVNSPTKRQLQDSWRVRLEESQARYQKAKEQYRELLQKQPDGVSHDSKGALALALQAQSEAFDEYKQILRAFTELALNGKIPEELFPASSDSL